MTSTQTTRDARNQALAEIVAASTEAVTADADQAQVQLRGLFGLDEDVRPGFGEVRVLVELRGPAPDAEYDRLQAAVDAHCPVLDLFRNPTPLITRRR
jgi:hypothetical protein